MQNVSSNPLPPQASGLAGSLGLPLDLQDDLFQAINETGLYELYADTVGQSAGPGIPELASPTGMLRREPPQNFAIDSVPPNSQPVVKQEGQQEVDGPNLSHGRVKSLAPPFQAGDMKFQAASINAAAAQAASQAAQVVAEARGKLSEATESSREVDNTDSPVVEPRSRKRRGSRSADAETPRAGHKGLRHFSLKVCEKVKEKGVTNYNEVADELVEDFRKAGAEGTETGSPGHYDEKNIRRRVYDALNVLMAMDIIQKEKKNITWKGFPRQSDEELSKLRTRKRELASQIQQKNSYLQELVEQHSSLRMLMDRNKSNPVDEKVHGILHLPFVLIQTERDATVEVFISDDMQNVQMDFGRSPFQIHDDGYLLKQMTANNNALWRQSATGNTQIVNQNLPSNRARSNGAQNTMGPPARPYDAQTNLVEIQDIPSSSA
mmetsp:Transcript_406/g.846  ORF Transcript_406/g.846 Transcript_406/m.846 type:complete len:436 (-) Transcript_406:409-1716(-)